VSTSAPHDCLLIVQPTHQKRKLYYAGAPQGLDVLPLLIQVVQQRVVRLVEQVSRRRRQPREDVTRAGRILAALQPCPELTCGSAACVHPQGYLCLTARTATECAHQPLVRDVCHESCDDNKMVPAGKQHGHDTMSSLCCVCIPGSEVFDAPLCALRKRTRGVQQVDVVAAHKVLRQPDDRAGQARLAVVVRAVLRHIPGQLSHLWWRLHSTYGHRRVLTQRMANPDRTSMTRRGESNAAVTDIHLCCGLHALMNAGSDHIQYGYKRCADSAPGATP